MRRARNGSSQSRPKIGSWSGGDDRVVGVEDETGVGVVALRRSARRGRRRSSRPRPRRRRRARRHRPTCASAEAGAEEADVAVDVGVDEVLGRRLVELERVEEFVPVARDVDAHQGFGGRVPVAQAGEGEGDRLARTRQRGEIAVGVGDDRAVPRRADMQRDVGLVLDVDDLVARRGTAVVRRTSGSGSDRSDRPSRRTGPARRCRRWSCPRRCGRSGRAGRAAVPGMVPPLIETCGVTMRARYQRIGAPRLEVRDRWRGSACRCRCARRRRPIRWRRRGSSAAARRAGRAGRRGRRGRPGRPARW